MTNDEFIDVYLSSEEALSLRSCEDFVLSNNCGGIVHFVGTVRNQTKGKKVLKLDFEAYEPMAIKEMQKIAERALEQFDIQKIAIHHRTGSLIVGEIPVIIAVSSAHRKAAFTACEFAIDTLKETVPIWKKEYFEDGEVWVSATP
jgi:molybdopterin synthase catalytic subunit